MLLIALFLMNSAYAATSTTLSSTVTTGSNDVTQEYTTTRIGTDSRQSQYVDEITRTRVTTPWPTQMQTQQQTQTQKNENGVNSSTVTVTQTGM